MKFAGTWFHFEIWAKSRVQGRPFIRPVRGLGRTRTRRSRRDRLRRGNRSKSQDSVLPCGLHSLLSFRSSLARSHLPFSSDENGTRAGFRCVQLISEPRRKRRGSGRQDCSRLTECRLCFQCQSTLFITFQSDSLHSFLDFHEFNQIVHDSHSAWTRDAFARALALITATFSLIRW